MRKHSQHNKDKRTQFFRKLYLSHIIRNGTKGLRKGYVWEVSWRLNKAATYWPPALLAIAALLSLVLLGCSSRGPKDPSLRWLWFSLLELQQLTPNSDLQLTRTSCSTGLYNCLTFTCFSERRICTQFNSSIVKVIPWYLRPDAPVIYTGAFFIWQLGRVGCQYVTFLPEFYLYKIYRIYNKPGKSNFIFQ